MVRILASTDPQAMAVIVAFGLLLIVSYGFGSRCRAEGGCHKLFGQKRSERYLKEEKTTVRTYDEWVLETTKSIVREDYSKKSDAIEWQGRSRDHLVEKVKYEIEEVTQYPVADNCCRFCDKTWIFEFPAEVHRKRRRIGP